MGGKRVREGTGRRRRGTPRCSSKLREFNGVFNYDGGSHLRCHLCLLCPCGDRRRSEPSVKA